MRGTRVGLATPRHLQSEVGNIIFGSAAPVAQPCPNYASSTSFATPSSHVEPAETTSHVYNHATHVTIAPSTTVPSTVAPSTNRCNTPLSGSFLDDLLPRRKPGAANFNAARSSEDHNLGRSSVMKVRDAQESAHARDTVPANVFNAVQAGGSATPLLHHPCFKGAAGMPSDSEVAQTHPDLPGKNGTPRRIRHPGAPVADATDAAPTGPPLSDAPRDSSVVNAAQTDACAGVARSARPTFPWEHTSILRPDDPAPPEQYAAADAGAAERSRYRGVRRVNTHLARESNSDEPGGVLSQAGFPDAAPRRWDDAMFEARLKTAVSGRPTPRPTPRQKTTPRR